MLNQNFLGLIKLNRKKESFTASIVIYKQPLDKLLAIKHTFLHIQEERYFETLVAKKRQLSYLLGRYVAKKAIAACVHEDDLRKIEIASGIFQQPIVYYYTKQNIQVSISHCEEWGTSLAFPEAHPMAIDVESIIPERDFSSLLQLSPKEKILIEEIKLNFNEREKMTIVWTIKEALSKVLKTGLMTQFQIYEISSIHIVENYYFESLFTNFAQYRAISWLDNNLAWSIVLPKNSNFNIQQIIDRGEDIKRLPPIARPSLFNSHNW